MTNRNNILVCKDVCESCKEHFLIDMHCNSDYYNTVIGFVKQRYCPCCGRMLPMISERDPEYISNNRKRQIGVRICQAYGLGYKTVRNIIVRRMHDVHDVFVFVRQLSHHLNIAPEKILRCIDN